MSDVPNNPMPRVLVVDDKAFVRTVTGRILEDIGVTEIAYAADGRAAIAAIERADPVIDVVMCDLVMPDMDGVEVVRYVSELPYKPAFIFISGQSASLLTTAVDMARARGLNVLGAIEKPIRREIVQAMLAKPMRSPAPHPPREDVPLTVDDLARAIDAGHIVLHFQPKVDVRTSAVVGYESLARWQHPTHGLIPPGQFIAMAEESDLIRPLTDTVMQLALRQAANWNDAGFVTKVSVNISAHMLVDLKFPDRIAREAEQHRVDPAQIVLEITETGVDMVQGYFVARPMPASDVWRWTETWKKG